MKEPVIFGNIKVNGTLNNSILAIYLEQNPIEI